MSVPNFYFVDGSGNRLPTEEETGFQHLRQFASRWRVHVEGEWEGSVVIEGNPRLFLEPVNHNNWELPRGSDRLKGSVGSLSASLFDSSGQSIGPKQVLRIQPANTSWNELEQMLEDIGNLAVLSTSCTQANLWTPIKEDQGLEGAGIPLATGRGPLRTANSLIALYETIKSSWPIIQQRPLKSIVSKLGIVRLDKTKQSPMLMIRRKMEPNRITSSGLVIEEDIHCPENGFLAYIIDHYLISSAEAIKVLLESAQEQLRNIDFVNSVPFPNARRIKLKAFADAARSRASEINKQYDEYRRIISVKVSQLDTIIKWATVARSSGFLKSVVTPRHLPIASLRLIHSPYYGPVYAKFLECQTTTMGGLERVLYLFETKSLCIIIVYFGFQVSGNLRTGF